MASVKLIWATPDGDKQVAYMARVSNPNNQDNEATAPKLISFLIRNRHWSPFEMVSACIEIQTTRDIGRQILRHRSFSFQEFSQRYAEVSIKADDVICREMRNKGSSNRQGSLDECNHAAEGMAMTAARYSFGIYKQLIEAGVAPECARAVLPEGFAPTRMYMTGTIRSWIHYIAERTTHNVQKEHREIAATIGLILTAQFPSIFEAVQLAKHD